MKLRFSVLLFAISTAATGAQTVSTSDPGEESVALPLPLPALQTFSFVSPDASLVARPDDFSSLGPQPTVAPSVAPMRVQLEASRARDGAAELAFRGDTPQIFIRWRGQNLPVGATVRLDWIAEDVGDLVEPGFVVDRSKVVVEAVNFGGRLTVSRPQDGWAPGKYRVDLYIDDQLKDTLGVTIRE